MAIAHETTGTFGATPDTASPMDWTHAFTSSSRGLVVLIVTADNADTITSVTIDPAGANINVPRVRWQNVAGETGSAYAYFLGSGLPTASATIRVVFTGTVPHMGCSVSVTAADDTSVEDHQAVSSTSLANPSITLTTNNTTITYGALYSGTAGPNSTAPDANHTDIQEADFGSETSSCIRRSATVAAGTPAVGWTVAADDVAAVALAVREGVPVVIFPSILAVITRESNHRSFSW